MTANSRRNWNRIQPISLRHAMELCKDRALERGLSIERIADRTFLNDHWTLYKWIANGRMPASYIRAFEEACGADFITRWLAISAGKLLIDMPTGRALKDADVVELHNGFAAALQCLTDFYSGKSNSSATLEALTNHLNQVAFHRQNVAKHATPELEF